MEEAAVKTGRTSLALREEFPGLALRYLTVEAVRKRFPRVGFVGLDVAGSKADARRRVLANGWRFPMAVDRDGAVSGLYRVGVGPMTFFAYPGGITMSTAFGELDERALVARVGRLVAASRRLELFP
jgi:hypothetical protein